MSRRHIATALRSRSWATAALPLFDLAYCDASRLSWNNRSIWSTEGVRQGCGLGPLLFCVGIADVLRHVQRRYKKVKIYAYMDDISLVSSDPDELKAALALLLSEAAKINLHANLSKTFAHGPLMGACSPATPAPTGVKILGAWIAAPGNEEAEQNFIRKKRLSHDPLFQKIPQLSSETSFAVLRFCAHPVWNYITRVHPDTLQESIEFDACVRSTLSKIVDVPTQDFTIDHNKLMHLPSSCV
ncbi:MAG: hypothetical protein EBR86_17650 [Planctomycetia bacterium]|nr:hypothetical protein [Planctomycetia bacterium]